jgi:hypothetical protein
LSKNWHLRLVHRFSTTENQRRSRPKVDHGAQHRSQKNANVRFGLPQLLKSDELPATQWRIAAPLRSRTAIENFSVTLTRADNRPLISPFF